jgi:hypothetical protein
MSRFLTIVTLLVFITGCGKETNALKETIIRYDALLAEGYRSLNMNPLTQAATEQRATKAYHHMAALGEAGVKMESTLRNMKFLKVKTLSKEQAEVNTEEIWDYAYLDIKSGKSLFDNTVTYNLKYDLVKKSDQWLVSDITVGKSVEKKSSQGIFERPHHEAIMKGKDGEAGKK